MTDMIDLSTVQIFNSPDIHDWPATTDITRLELLPSGVHVEFTKQNGPDRWPDVPFGDPTEHGNLQFTLWIVLERDGQRRGAGCIEFWFGLHENGGPVDEYAKNWYYDPNRWPGMAGHQPAVGERVGFLITSGDARHGNEQVGLHERSHIVAIDFPTAAGAVFTFAAQQPPAPPLPVPQPPTPQPPTVQPPAPPAPVPPSTVSGELVFAFELLERLVNAVEEHARAALAIETAVEKIAREGIQVHS